MKEKKEKEKQIKKALLDIDNPRGEEAIRPSNLSIQSKVLGEGVIENLVNAFDKISTNQDFVPILLGKVKGQIIAIPLQRKKGKYLLPNLSAPTDKEINHKKGLAKKIIELINPVLKRDIGDVAELALLRKDVNKLKILLADLKEGKKPHLSNRVGCIFLDVGDETYGI